MLWNPANYYIGPNEGLSGNVHLLDPAAVFVGGEGSRPYWRFTDRGIEFDAVVTGTTAANAQANVTAISVMLQRASRARGAYGIGTAIVLSMQLADTTWRYLDVTGGTISPVRDYVGGRNALVTLTLNTLPYARGDAVTIGPNLLASANDLDAASWVRTNLTATANVRTDPFGATTAETIRETAITGNHELSQAITKAAAAIQYTLSVYAQADGRNVLQLYLSDAGGANGAFGAYNLTTGTLYFAAGTAGTGWSGVSATIAAAGGGWYRCTLTATSNTATTVKAWLQLHNGSTTSYLGVVTNGLLLWGAQLEAASSAGPLLSLTNGLGSTWLTASIPGDVPALARITYQDVSTGASVINGIHTYSRAVYGMVAGDVDHAIEMLAATPGVATTDASSYSGSSFARLGANSTWQTIAEATRPTGDYNNGLYDVWLRVRDSSTVPGIPRELKAAVTTGATVTVRGSATGNSTTIAGATTAELTADDILVLVVRGNSRTVTISSITSVGGATWTLATDGANDARVVHGVEAAQVNVYWLRPASTIAVGTTIAVTFSAAMGANYQLLQLTGLAAVSSIDAVAPDTTVTNSVSITTGAVTTTQAVTMLITVVANNSNSNYGGFTNGFSVIAQGSGYSIGGRLATAIGTYSTAATAGTSTNDHVGTLVAFKALATTAPSLTVGTWNLRVTAVGSTGLLSAVTDVVQVTVANTNDSIQLSWMVPAGSTPSSYRVQRDRGTGWGYVDTGSTATAYTWTTETGITTDDPDLDGDARGLFRVQVALDGGVTLFTGPSFSARLGNSMWEDVLAGTLSLPPIPALDAANPPAWLLRVQGKHADVSPELDVDIAWLAPHDAPQALAQYTGLALATKRDWVIDQRRDGRISGRLYASGTTSDAGQVDTIGQLAVGPGATQIAVRMTGASGVSDVTNLKAIATLRYVPRWRLVRGV